MRAHDQESDRSATGKPSGPVSCSASLARLPAGREQPGRVPYDQVADGLHCDVGWSRTCAGGKSAREPELVKLVDQHPEQLVTLIAVWQAQGRARQLDRDGNQRALG